MFDYTLLHWTTFFSAALLLAVAPGPDLAFILGHTARGGQRAGFAAMFGVWTGASCHVLLAAIGLSAILTTSAFLFTLVKWLGAVYLIWLGLQALRSQGAASLPDGEEGGAAGIRERAIYRQGVLVAALNPKTALFFLAFLPQFVVEGAGASWAQLLLHGLLVLVAFVCVNPPYVVLGARLTKRLQNSQRMGKLLDRGLGVLFLGLGLRLLFSNQ